MFNTATDNKNILYISTNKCFFAVQIYADKHLYTDKLTVNYWITYFKREFICGMVKERNQIEGQPNLRQRKTNKQKSYKRNNL